MNAPPKLPRRPKPAQTMTSREFNQHTGRAKRLADKGPVVITDRGEPAYVLLSEKAYATLTGAAEAKANEFVSILDALAQPGGPEYDFDVDFERAPGRAREVDFGDP